MKKRLGYVIMVVGGLISIGFNVYAAFELAQVGFPTPIWTAIGLFLFFVGVFAVLHYQSNEKEQVTSSNISGITLRPKSRLGGNGLAVTINLKSQMHRIHGHDDIWGIQSDYLNGIDTNEILKRNCTVCGKPRNQSSIRRTN